jgi:hypothetical protein
MVRTRTYVAFLSACAILLAPIAATASQPSIKKATQQPVSKSKYLTHISTDKPIYQIGEKVYVRGVLLRAATNAPLPVGTDALAHFEITNPNGQTIAKGKAATKDSVWSFEYPIGKNLPGGEYTVKTQEITDTSPPAERKFEIRAYRAPRLNSHITFLRDGYGPGEKVQANLEVKRAEGGFPTGAKVTVNATVDGVNIPGDLATIDAEGNCSVGFALPEQITAGQGTLALTIADGGVVENASKTIPILLNTVDVNIYPEGGDLVRGYKNRVYFEAFQPNGKPADIEGEVVSKNAAGKEFTITKVSTVHEGRGRFEFVPETTGNYFLKIAKPYGISKQFKLPAVRLHGAVLTTKGDIVKSGQPLNLQLGASTGRTRIVVSKRGKEVATRTVITKAQNATGQTMLSEVSLPLPTDVNGVLTVTVFGDADFPLAERLVYREPAKALTISITTDKKTYTPGSEAEVKIKATDADGKPVSATVGVTVTDESILQMVEKREQAPRLPVMALLEPDVKDLADAQIYLDSQNKTAPLATDLLLGTQGWRRFAMAQPYQFFGNDGDKAKRAIVDFDMAKVDSKSDWHGRYTEPKKERHYIGAFYLPEEIGHVEGPRDMNIFQVEPTVLNERRYVSGREERHQKPSPRIDDEAVVNDIGNNDDRYNSPGYASLQSFEIIQRYVERASLPVVREFAHQVRPDRKANDRVDFAQTLYWNAAVKTDEKGEGTVKFGLSDSVTTFQVMADGFTQDGALGAGNLALTAVPPFYAEAKLPLQVTSGDQIMLPISLINAGTDLLNGASISVKLDGPFSLQPLLQQLNELTAGARARCLQPIKVGFGKGLMEFVLNARAGAFEDKVTRQLAINPTGFPAVAAFGGTIEPGKKAKLKVIIDDTLVPDSMNSKFEVFTSPLGNLTSALEQMIQEPHGCFEQTSSTSYPLTLAQQYFLSHPGVPPRLVAQSKEQLDKAYTRLVSFWCPDRGYEWFGQNPGHTVLTAYALMHFADMAKVRNVDQQMVATTKQWLLAQRNGNGTFKNNQRYSWGWAADADCSNAYIVWALLETGHNAADLQTELRALKTAASNSKNSYVIAAAANAFYLANDKQFARQLMDKLVRLQKTDGSIGDVTTSIVGSTGNSLIGEGTSLATLAWLRDPQYAGNAAQGIRYLASCCKEGVYGSTQATVLALRAIVNYDKQREQQMAAGKVRMFADGKPIGGWIAFDKNSDKSLKLPDLAKVLGPGEHTVELEMVGGGIAPYSLALNYSRAQCPATDKDCSMKITANLAQSKLTEGASTEAIIVVENVSNEAVPSPVAIIGIPGGLEPRHDQLKELVKLKTIDSYEVDGRQVVLYWRSLPANSKLSIPLNCVAAVPGSYTGAASRAYLYYTNEHKNWTDGMHVEIAAK